MAVPLDGSPVLFSAESSVDLTKVAESAVIPEKKSKLDSIFVTFLLYLCVTGPPNAWPYPPPR